MFFRKISERVSSDDLPPARTPWPRASTRLELSAAISLRSPRFASHPSLLSNLSRHGCCVDLTHRVVPGDKLWVKLPGLAAIETVVIWEDEFIAGVEFAQPLHAAVMEMLSQQLTEQPAPPKTALGRRRLTRTDR